MIKLVLQKGKAAMNKSIQVAQQLVFLIEQNIRHVIIGKDEVIRLLMIALTAGGHVLLEDVPGIGKTTLVSAFAKSLALSFKRIQFTPDIMPSDVTGFNLYNQKTSEFEFQAGAVMSQILLADEINRTSPKTQSALLEVMQENQVTVDGVTYPVPKPFMTLATQNPVEHVGTYPLPEAQLDRFMLKITMGYPSVTEEMEILSRYELEEPIDALTAVASADDLLWLQNQTKRIYCSKAVKRYVALIASATRNHPDLLLGVSPRASKMLMDAARARALLDGREFVTPDDIQNLMHAVLAHRLLIKPESRLRQVTIQDCLNDIMLKVKVPEA